MLKRGLRKLFSKRTLLVLTGVGACLVLFAFLPTRPQVLKAPPPPLQDDAPVVVHVLSHGWNTGIVVKTADLAGRIPRLGERFRGYEHLEIGWGDAGFYQA